MTSNTMSGKSNKVNPFQWIHSRNEKLFKCDQCNIIFNFQKDMIDHFIHDHDYKVCYACSFCLKNFDSSNTLLDHFESQHIVLYYACSKCRVEFTSLTELLTHTLSQRSCKQLSSSQTIAVEKRYLSCGLCLKQFSLPSLLRSHMALHLGTYNCYKGHKVNAEKVCFIDHFVNFSCGTCDNHSKTDDNTEENSMSSTLRKAIDCISNNENDVIMNNKIDKSDDDDEVSNTVVICGECNTRFKNMKSLTRHLKNEHDVDVQIADDDNEDNLSEEETNLAIKKGFSRRYSCTFLCIFCLKRFVNKHTLESHEKIHSQAIDPDCKLQMSCDYCENTFTGHINYKKHISTCSEKPQALKDTNKSNSSVTKSLESHPKDAQPMYEYVKLELRNENASNNEEDEIDWNESEITEVRDCDLTHVTKALTKLESSTYTNNKITKKPISITSSKYLNDESDADFEDTINSKPKSTPVRGKGEAKVYVCHYCEKGFRSKQKFLDHYFNHDNSVKPYGCPACDTRLGYSTSVPKHIQMHLRDLGTITVERKPHLCPKCGKDYRDRASLKRHEAMVHLKIGHLCLECDRKFSSPHALKQHLHQHTGDYIYECDQCDKRYGNASSLHNHKKSHSEMKFVCDICAKAFSLKHHLLRHITTHTGFAKKNVKKLKQELTDVSL